MTRHIRSIAMVLALAASAVFSAAEAQPGVKLPSYKKLKLTNGMTVLLAERHQVPLVSIQYIVRAGSTADPAGKEGLASITADLLRKGTAKRNADQISEALDSVGATWGAGAGLDYSVGRAEFMKKDIASGIDMVADMLISPTFPEAEVKKLVAQNIDGVRGAKDDAQSVIRNYYDAFLFGTYPYGRPVDGDEKSLAAITRADAVKFHAGNYIPANTILAVVGDFNTVEMEKLLSSRFGAWTSTAKPATAQLAAAKLPAGKRLLLVDKPDSTQTYFMIGTLGVARDNPDRVPIQLVNTLFGGRYTSMINTALRIQNGLTYGASSFFLMNKVPGPFIITSYTRNAATEKALDMTLEVLHELHAKGVTDEDLATAKAYIKGTLAQRSLETNDQLAGTLLDLQFYGLPDSEINDYFARVDATTVADARRVIEKYYPEKDLTLVLIGKASEIQTAAKKYAPEMKVKSITEPGY
jgi:predicted Zn-dependent peptidase